MKNMKKRLFIIVGILLFIILLFFLAKILLPGMIPPFKLYPSDSTILKTSAKYNYCSVDSDCGIFLYRNSCAYKTVPINNENEDKLLAERDKWIYFQGEGDCIAYRPAFSAYCDKGKCIIKESK